MDPKMYNTLLKFEDCHQREKIISHLIDINGQVSDIKPCRKVILSGSFNPIHEGHRRLAQVSGKLLKLPYFFELSISNVDKNVIPYKELCRRLDQFKGIGNIFITNARTFLEKSKIFENTVFAVGYDTAVRLFDKNYYDKSINIEHIFDVIENNKCTFIIGGRKVESSFKTKSDIIIPKKFSHLFKEITEKEFRTDISSAKIRDELIK